MKTNSDYHFERKRQLQEYKGNQNRLVSILNADHGEAIKESVASPIKDKERVLISKEEFLDSIK